jgi:hypothetical protein
VKVLSERELGVVNWFPWTGSSFVLYDGGVKISSDILEGMSELEKELFCSLWRRRQAYEAHFRKLKGMPRNTTTYAHLAIVKTLLEMAHASGPEKESPGPEERRRRFMEVLSTEYGIELQ